MDVDPACEAACSANVSGPGADLRDALTTCRTTGAGATKCPECHRTPDAGTLFAEVCPPATADASACSQCHETTCCDSIAACTADASCTSLRQCAAACPTDDTSSVPCFLGCTSMYPDGVALYGKMLACEGYHCEHESTVCGSLDACQDHCTFGTCPSEWIACLSDPGCLQLFVCAADCELGTTSESCIDGCNAAWPATVSGDGLLTALGNCEIGCMPPCGAPP